MCGRFALFSSKQAILNYYKALNKLTDFQKSFNIAPQQYTPVVIRYENKDMLVKMKWGLIPFWSKTDKYATKMINARAETVEKKPAYKYAFKYRRCLIPVNGIFEWHFSNKQPYFIRMKDNRLFSLAGLWEKWKNESGEKITTFTIITKNAEGNLKQIHKRMPVVLTKKEHLDWVKLQDLNEAKRLLFNENHKKLEFYKISKRVNSPQNNDEKIINQVK